MSLDEKFALHRKSMTLREEGKVEEAIQVEKSIPLPPYMAKWWKKYLGADSLLEQGFNLSEAEIEYGQNWLTQ
jgi:hypothetical protein